MVYLAKKKLRRKIERERAPEKTASSKKRVVFKLDEDDKGPKSTKDDGNGSVFDDDLEDPFDDDDGETGRDLDKKKEGKKSKRKVSFKLDDKEEGEKRTLKKVSFKLDNDSEGSDESEEGEDREEQGDSPRRLKNRPKRIKEKKRRKARKKISRKKTDKKEDKEEEEKEEEDDEEVAEKIKPKKTAQKLVKKREVVDKNKVMALAKKNLEIERALENFKRAYRSLRDEVDTLGAEKDTKEALITKYQNKLDLYAQDFDNFKERVKKEKKSLEVQGNQRLVKKMLEIFDNHARAIENTKPDDKAEGLLNGVEMMQKKFIGILAEEDIEPIESLGEKFDPRLHEAIAMIESDKYEDGIVCTELQKGFKFIDEEPDEEDEEEEEDEKEDGEEGEKDKKRKIGELIRPALVHVSKGGSSRKKKPSDKKDSEKPKDREKEGGKKEAPERKKKRIQGKRESDEKTSPTHKKNMAKKKIKKRKR